MLTALLTGESPLKTYAKTTNPGFDQSGRRCLLSRYFLPLFVPFMICLYDILMRMAWQVTRDTPQPLEVARLLPALLRSRLLEWM